MNIAETAPSTLEVDGRTISLKPLAASDGDALLAFAKALPAHDLLFLQRDIRNPKVIEAWLEQIDSGWIESLVAVEEGRIVACTAMVRDALSWSAHVAEVRILVAPECRGIGLGRLLGLHCLDRARESGIEKLSVRMTPDQTGALKLFEEMGFRPEALRQNHVRDAEGQTSDLLILALDVAKHRARQHAFGLGS